MPDYVSNYGYPMWVTGSVSVSGLAFSGSISITDVTADQGNPNTLAEAWPVKLTDGLEVLGTPSMPLAVTGSVYVLNPSGGVGNLNGQVAVTSSVALIVTGSAVQPTTPVLSSFGYVTASFVVLSASSRIKFSIWNDSDQNCVVAFGSGSASASLTSFSFNLGSQTLYESTYPSYRGTVTAFWVSTATGSLFVTELFQ